MMKLVRTLPKWPLLFLFLIAFVTSGLTQANTVDASRALDHLQPLGADDLKPAACANITLTDKISGSGTLLGTAANELIVGNNTGVNADGGDGDDCIIGGSGNDTLTGGNGVDVCIGNGGTDAIDPSCETVLP